MSLVDIMSQIYGFILKTGQKFCNFALTMKKKTLITGLAAGFCFAAMMTGCDQQGASGPRSYTVTCSLDGQMKRDSATLLVLEEDYHKLRVCGTARAHEGRFTFKGQTEGPKVALLRWGNDTTRPFHFVLEAGNIALDIKPGSWRVTGSAQNRDYMRFVNQRNAIVNARVALWQDYLKAAENSTLKRDDELRMVRQDSLLNDSLQRITVERINRGDAVARIIRDRYASQLDQQHMRRLK